MNGSPAEKGQLTEKEAQVVAKGLIAPPDSDRRKSALYHLHCLGFAYRDPQGDIQACQLWEGLHAKPKSPDRDKAKSILQEFGYISKDEQKKKSGPYSDDSRYPRNDRNVLREIASLLGTSKSTGPWKEGWRGLVALKSFHSDCERGFFLSRKLVLDLIILSARRRELWSILDPCIARLYEIKALTAADYFETKLPQEASAYPGVDDWNDGINAVVKEAAAYFGIPVIRPRIRVLEMLLRYLRHAWLITDGSKYVTVDDFGTAYGWAHHPKGGFLTSEFNDLSRFFELARAFQKIAPSWKGASSHLPAEKRLEFRRTLLGLSSLGADTPQAAELMKRIEDTGCLNLEPVPKKCHSKQTKSDLDGAPKRKRERASLPTPERKHEGGRREMALLILRHTMAITKLATAQATPREVRAYLDAAVDAEKLGDLADADELDDNAVLGLPDQFGFEEVMVLLQEAADEGEVDVEVMQLVLTEIARRRGTPGIEETDRIAREIEANYADVATLRPDLGKDEKH